MVVKIKLEIPLNIATVAFRKPTLSVNPGPFSLSMYMKHNHPVPFTVTTSMSESIRTSESVYTSNKKHLKCNRM